MHKIAKATSIELGPRAFQTASGKKIVGFLLTREELRQIFAKEGFNVSTSSTWINRMKQWEIFGDVTPVGTTLFFLTNDTRHRVAVEKVATSNGIQEVIV